MDDGKVRTARADEIAVSFVQFQQLFVSVETDEASGEAEVGDLAAKRAREVFEWVEEDAVGEEAGVEAGEVEGEEWGDCCDSEAER